MRQPENPPQKQDRLLPKAVLGDLMAKAKRGDRSALDHLLGQLRPALYLLAVRRLRNEADALDAVQESLLKIFQQLASFDPARGSVSSWTSRICVNETVNILRRGRSRPPLPIHIDDQVVADPAVLAEEAESQRLIQAAAAALPADEQAAVHLRFVDDLSYKEAAAVAGVPLGTIAGRTYRGLSSLRKRLRPTG